MGERLRDKVALVAGAGSVGPAGGTARRLPCCSRAKEPLYSAWTFAQGGRRDSGHHPRRRRTGRGMGVRRVAIR